MEKRLMRFVPGKYRENSRRNAKELIEAQRLLDEAVEAQIRGERLPIHPHDSEGSIANGASFIRNRLEAGIASQRLMPGFSVRRSFRIDGSEVFLYKSLKDLGVSGEGIGGLLDQPFLVGLSVLEHGLVIVKFHPLFEGRGIKGPVPDVLIKLRYGDELKANSITTRRAVDLVGASRDNSRYSRAR